MAMDDKLESVKRVVHAFLAPTGDYKRALAALEAEGWTPPKAPEAVRLVTMEESAERYNTAVSRGAAHGVAGFTSFWLAGDRQREVINDADNWLVRTVNRRLIGGLPTAFRQGAPDLLLTGGPSGCTAHRDDLLRIFCGEGGK